MSSGSAVFLAFSSSRSLFSPFPSVSPSSLGRTPRALRTGLNVHLPGSMSRGSGVRAIGQQGCRLAGDGEFLISGNDGDLGGGAGRGDDPSGPGWRIVQHRVYDDAEPVQAVGDGGAQRGIVLPHTGGEGQHIKSTQDRQICTDIVLQPVHIHLERQLGILVARGTALLQLPKSLT